MIKITYENDKSAYDDTFSAYFETQRGASMFQIQLNRRDVDYDVEWGVEL